MSNPARTIEPDEYDVIEDAVAQTPRGRWFLQEHARRHSATNTAQVLEAIEKLYTAARADFVYHELQEMRRSVADARYDIAAVKPGERRNDTTDLDAVAEASHRAAVDIARAAERLQEIAEALRKNNADADLCDEIETHATGIFMASAFHVMTGQRIEKIVESLGDMEARATRLVSRWEETR